MTDQSHSSNTLYADIAEQLETSALALTSGTLAERFYQAMLANLRFVVARREDLRRMIIGGFEGNDTVVQTGLTNYPRMNAAMHTIVSGSVDSLSPAQVEQMTVVLTNFHLLFMLFILHDRTEGNTATFQLLAFARDAFTLIRPLLMIPPGAKAMARLSTILATALAGGSTANGETTR